jgi:acetate kinase
LSSELRSKIQDILEHAGAADLSEALSTWQAERQGMAELHDENTALRLINRRLRLAIGLFVRILDKIDGQMFLPAGIQDKINLVRDQLKMVDRDLVHSAYIANEKRTNHAHSIRFYKISAGWDRSSCLHPHKLCRRS